MSASTDFKDRYFEGMPFWGDDVAILNKHHHNTFQDNHNGIKGISVYTIEPSANNEEFKIFKDHNPLTKRTLADCFDNGKMMNTSMTNSDFYYNENTLDYINNHLQNIEYKDKNVEDYNTCIVVNLRYVHKNVIKLLPSLFSNMRSDKKRYVLCLDLERIALDNDMSEKEKIHHMDYFLSSSEFNLKCYDLILINSGITTSKISERENDELANKLLQIDDHYPSYSRVQPLDTHDFDNSYIDRINFRTLPKNKLRNIDLMCLESIITNVSSAIPYLSVKDNNSYYFRSSVIHDFFNIESSDTKMVVKIPPKDKYDDHRYSIDNITSVEYDDYLTTSFDRKFSRCSPLHPTNSHYADSVLLYEVSDDNLSLNKTQAYDRYLSYLLSNAKDKKYHKDIKFILYDKY